jgi:DNA-binding transcriptional regulator YiaG
MTIMICDQLTAIPADTWATASMTAAVSSNAEHVMSPAYADEAVHIREVAPLTARDIARATGTGQSTVEAWLARTRAPSGTRAERVLELAAIVEQAARVLRPDAIPVWLNKPVASLHKTSRSTSSRAAITARSPTCSPGSRRGPSAEPVSLDVSSFAVIGGRAATRAPRMRPRRKSERRARRQHDRRGATLRDEPVRGITDTETTHSGEVPAPMAPRKQRNSRQNALLAQLVEHFHGKGLRVPVRVAARKAKSCVFPALFDAGAPIRRIAIRARTSPRLSNACSISAVWDGADVQGCGRLKQAAPLGDPVSVHAAIATRSSSS